MIEPSFPQFYVFGIIALYYFRTNDPVHFPNLQMTMVRRGAWARVTISLWVGKVFVYRRRLRGILLLLKC
jgi:hypothetical protein